jgi:hypothetical protein
VFFKERSMSERPPTSDMGFTDRMRARLNALAFVAGVFSAFAEVTLFRKHMGERYFQGMRFLLVIPLLFFFPLLTPEHDPRPMLACIPFYLIMIAVHRIGIARRKRRGQLSVHSRYDGVSRLARLFPKLDEAALKSGQEPGLLIVISMPALGLSPSLGLFLITCAAGMMIHTRLLIAAERERGLDLADAMLEGASRSRPFHPASAAQSKATAFVTIHRSSS